MLPGDVTWGVEAGIDVCHQLLDQGTGIVEDAAEQPQTREVGPELQQYCHPLPCHRGVQSDIGVANMHTFPGEVHVRGQTSGHLNVGGEPLWENWNCIPTPIMAAHSPPSRVARI